MADRVPRTEPRPQEQTGSETSAVALVSDRVPGTFEAGFNPDAALLQQPIPAAVRRLIGGGETPLQAFTIGETRILVGKEPAGANGEKLLHLTISCEDRHPTWDEIKRARYRLLPKDRCFGMLLPPPEQYVNVPAQDHVFHLWEITDPRAPWSTG